MGGLLLSLAPLTNAALALLLVFGVVTTGDSVFFRVIFACYQMMFVLLIFLGRIFNKLSLVGGRVDSMPYGRPVIKSISQNYQEAEVVPLFFSKTFISLFQHAFSISF